MKSIKKILKSVLIVATSLLFIAGCSQNKESEQISASSVDFNVKTIKSDNILSEAMGSMNDMALKSNLDNVYVDIIVKNENKDDNLTNIAIPFSIDLLQEDDLKYTVLDDIEIRLKNGDTKFILRSDAKDFYANEPNVNLSNTLSSENQVWIDIEGEYDPDELASNISNVLIMLGNYQDVSDVTLFANFDNQ